MFILFGSTLTFWIAVSLVIIIIAVSEINENGFFATGVIVCFLGIMYFKGTYDLSWFSISYMVYYLIAGLIYSFVRTYFWGREQKRRIIKTKKSWTPFREDQTFEESSEYRQIMSETKLKNHFFRWWGLWPVSLPLWFAGKFVKEFFIWLYEHMRDFIDSIRQKGFDSINEN